MISNVAWLWKRHSTAVIDWLVQPFQNIRFLPTKADEATSHLYDSLFDKHQNIKGLL